MPKIRFGPIFADARGSSGRITFSSNKAGPFTSRRPRPITTTTTAQATPRANFSGATQAWRALSPAQRTAWNDLAADPPETDYDPWAVQTYRSGFTWFVRVYARQATVSETLPTDPPADAQPDAPTITAATIAAYGSAHDASYITLTSPSPILNLNPGFEPPYTSGLAPSWYTNTPTRLTPTEESVDVYAGSASQKAAVITGAATSNLYSASFTLTTHPGYWIQAATKILAGQLSDITLRTNPSTYTKLWTSITNATWSLRQTLHTPASAGDARFYARNNPTHSGTFLLDSFTITAPDLFILSAAITPSPGRQAPYNGYRILCAGYSTTPTTISIGDALVTCFGAYPPGWTLHFKLERQTISGLRSPEALFSATTG